MKQQQLQQDTVYVDAIIDRLRECYLARTPRPTSAAAPLTADGFYRFYRYVLAEGYGQAEADQQRRSPAGRGAGRMPS